MGPQDKVTLSVRERQELAKLQSMLETADPDLAKKLARRGDRNGAGKPHLALVAPHRLSLLVERRWPGPLLAVAGLGLMLFTVASLVWLAMVGAVVVTGGLALWFSGLQRAGQAKGRAVRRAVPGLGGQSGDGRGDDGHAGDGAGV